MLNEEVEAELLFLKNKNFLFRYKTKQGEVSKFVNAAALRQAFCNETIDSGWLTPQIVRWGLAADSEWAILYVPPARQPLALVTESGELEAITVRLPGIVFLGKAFRYWIFAIKGDRFSPDAIAFKAPLPNIHGSGEICWGENSPPLASPQTMLVAWELFITSPFNGHLCDEKSKKFPSDVREALKLAAAEAHSLKKDLKFHDNDKKSIDSIIKRLLSQWKI